ncbi:thioredoxin family protein [Polaribacter sp. Q13]|uniref:thioredoxin family protein n=1 Tax=Polaribacter sp. Q13 TaxID=2806551 RepID=UPI00193BB85B|nr:thioredoxin family protein [Polaribacter sp. Q13]QVY67018.1 thioredoxin family protein [Polaribacter sp. Q13]
MKNVILGLSICFFSVANIVAQEQIIEEHKIELEETISLNWQPTFKDALKKSKNEKKPVLIYFTGSDWCGPCKILDKKLFHTQKFKDIADKDLILYEADSPRNLDLISSDKIEINNDLKRKFQIRTFPTLVFVNHKGKIIGYKKGLILTDYYYPFIQSVIENY